MFCATDEAMMQRYLDTGDPAFFEALVVKYRVPLLRFLSKKRCRPDDVEDVVQETFARAYRKCGSFDTSRKFRTWLYTIASNALVDHWRRRGIRRHVTSFSDADVVAEHVPDRAAVDLVERAELFEQVRLAVLCLPPVYRAVVRARYFRDMSYREISAELGIPSATCRTRVRTALAKLRHVCDGDPKNRFCLADGTTGRP